MCFSLVWLPQVRQKGIFKLNNEQMISCLEGLAETMARRWEEELNEGRDTVYAQAYAQLCQAVAALNAPKPFLQLGMHFLSKDNVLRVTICGGKVEVATKEMTTGGYEGYPAEAKLFRYHIDSPQGKALLEWLQGQSEILMAYEDVQEKDEEDEEPPYAPTASFDDDIVPAEPAYPCVCGDSHCSGCF